MAGDPIRFDLSSAGWIVFEFVVRTLFAMRLQCARLGMTALCLYFTILLLCATFRLSSLDLQTPIYIFSICDAASIPVPRKRNVASLWLIVLNALHNGILHVHDTVLVAYQLVFHQH